MKKTVTLILFSLLLICQPAFALDLDSAREQGLVRETAAGYLVTVKSTPEVQKLVNNINAERKQVYQKIAQRTNTQLNVVEQQAGKKLIAKNPK